MRIKIDAGSRSIVLPNARRQASGFSEMAEARAEGESPEGAIAEEGLSVVGEKEAFETTSGLSQEEINAMVRAGAPGTLPEEERRARLAALRRQVKEALQDIGFPVRSYESQEEYPSWTEVSQRLYDKGRLIRIERSRLELFIAQYGESDPRAQQRLALVKAQLAAFRKAKRYLNKAYRGTPIDEEEETFLRSVRSKLNRMINDMHVLTFMRAEVLGAERIDRLQEERARAVARAGVRWVVVPVEETIVGATRDVYRPVREPVYAKQLYELSATGAYKSKAREGERRLAPGAGREFAGTVPATRLGMGGRIFTSGYEPPAEVMESVRKMTGKGVGPDLLVASVPILTPEVWATAISEAYESKRLDSGDVAAISAWAQFEAQPDDMKKDLMSIATPEQAESMRQHAVEAFQKINQAEWKQYEKQAKAELAMSRPRSTVGFPQVSGVVDVEEMEIRRLTPSQILARGAGQYVVGETAAAREQRLRRSFATSTQPYEESDVLSRTKVYPPTEQATEYGTSAYAEPIRRLATAGEWLLEQELPEGFEWSDEQLRRFLSSAPEGGPQRAPFYMDGEQWAQALSDAAPFGEYIIALAHLIQGAGPGEKSKLGQIEEKVGEYLSDVYGKDYSEVSKEASIRIYRAAIDIQTRISEARQLVDFVVEMQNTSSPADLATTDYGLNSLISARIAMVAAFRDINSLLLRFYDRRRVATVERLPEIRVPTLEPSTSLIGLDEGFEGPMETAEGKFQRERQVRLERQALREAAYRQLSREPQEAISLTWSEGQPEKYKERLLARQLPPSTRERQMAEFMARQPGRALAPLRQISRGQTAAPAAFDEAREAKIAARQQTVEQYEASRRGIETVAQYQARKEEMLRQKKAERAAARAEAAKSGRKRSAKSIRDELGLVALMAEAVSLRQNVRYYLENATPLAKSKIASEAKRLGVSTSDWLAMVEPISTFDGIVSFMSPEAKDLVSKEANRRGTTVVELLAANKVDTSGDFNANPGGEPCACEECHGEAGDYGWCSECMHAGCHDAPGHGCQAPHAQCYGPLAMTPNGTHICTDCGYAV